MSDTLYLSLWYPNLRLEALPGKLTAVLGAFAAHGGEAKVYAATVWPVSWNETPVFERVYGRMVGGLEAGQDRSEPPGAEPRQAVEEALELLHDDYAYEFQIGWNLWELETEPGGIFAAKSENAGPHSTHPPDGEFGKEEAGPLRQAQGKLSTRPPHGELAQDDNSGFGAQDNGKSAKLDVRWARGPRLVRVTGYGPLFDEGAYEQDGHIRVDFGSDAPFLVEDAELDQIGGRYVEENLRQLVELVAAVEKTSGATARLLWSELGESLAQRLAARLGMEN